MMLMLSALWPVSHYDLVRSAQRTDTNDWQSNKPGVSDDSPLDVQCYRAMQNSPMQM